MCITATMLHRVHVKMGGFAHRTHICTSYVCKHMNALAYYMVISVIVCKWPNVVFLSLFLFLFTSFEMHSLILAKHNWIFRQIFFRLSFKSSSSETVAMGADNSPSTTNSRSKWGEIIIIIIKRSAQLQWYNHTAKMNTHTHRMYLHFHFACFAYVERGKKCRNYRRIVRECVRMCANDFKSNHCPCVTTPTNQYNAHVCKYFELARVSAVALWTRSQQRKSIKQQTHTLFTIKLSEHLLFTRPASR